MGAVTHADFTRCQNNRYQQREAANRAQRQALGAALLANPQPQPVYPRSVTCRSTPEGIMVRTVCN